MPETFSSEILPENAEKRTGVVPGEQKGKGLHYRKRKLEKIPAEMSDSEDEREADKRKRSKKGRRAKRRPHKGYYEMTEKERTRMEERERLRTAKIRERMMAKGHMLAPYNSTEFILSDHEDDTVRRLEQQLQDESNLFAVGPQRTAPPRRCGRDSSFSLDSDEGYFYSSPEDEEEFMVKEFSKDYELGAAARLDKMEKTELIREYLGMEKKVDGLEKRLEEINNRELMKALTGEVDYEFHRGEVPMEPETAEKIQVFQAEISRLLEENNALTAENAALKRRLGGRRFQSYSSSSSSSDSDDSSSSDSSSQSSDSEDERPEDLLEDRPEKTEDGKTEDTGYESTQSKEQTPEPDWSKEQSEKS